MLADLKKFLLRGNVVDLAVAVVIGAAFGAVIASFVGNILDPIIAAIFGEPDMSRVLAIEMGEAEMRIGAFIQSIFRFAIVGMALFFVVKAFETLQNRRASGEEDAPAPSEIERLLAEILEALRVR